MEQQPTVLVIMGSVRAGRRCPEIADWVISLARARHDFHYEPIDLRDWQLPMDDEAAIPATGNYAHAHTQAWSRKIAGADAIVFVTPQYNWGYPAVLKNALDHLYLEWRGKPAAIVSYGGHGGTKCAEQLRQIAAALKMQMVEASTAITLSEDVIRHGAALQPATDFAACVQSLNAMLDQLSDAVRVARSNASR